MPRSSAPGASSSAGTSGSGSTRAATTSRSSWKPATPKCTPTTAPASGSTWWTPNAPTRARPSPATSGSPRSGRPTAGGGSWRRCSTPRCRRRPDPGHRAPRPEKGARMPGTAMPPPDRKALTGLLAGVSFIAGVAGAIALADGSFPRPGADPAQIRTYFTQNAGPARLSAAGQAISAASLVQFATSVAKLAGRTGRGSRALQAAAVAGGGLAATSLATSAVTHAMLTGQNDDDDAARLARREFVAGGPVHGVGFGVLTGVLALAGPRTPAPATRKPRAPPRAHLTDTAQIHGLGNGQRGDDEQRDATRAGAAKEVTDDA